MSDADDLAKLITSIVSESTASDAETMLSGRQLALMVTSMYVTFIGSGLDATVAYNLARDVLIEPFRKPDR